MQALLSPLGHAAADFATHFLRDISRRAVQESYKHETLIPRAEVVRFARFKDKQGITSPSSNCVVFTLPTPFCVISFL